MKFGYVVPMSCMTVFPALSAMTAQSLGDDSTASQLFTAALTYPSKNLPSQADISAVEFQCLLGWAQCYAEIDLLREVSAS